MQRGAPAFTVCQPDEAMHVLRDKASQLDVCAKLFHSLPHDYALFTLPYICTSQVQLTVVPSLDPELLQGHKLGLEGEHQYLNARLAIALSSTWLHRTGHSNLSYKEQSVSSTYGICHQFSINISRVF